MDEGTGISSAEASDAYTRGYASDAALAGYIYTCGWQVRYLQSHTGMST
jgi:hypothetical protein